MIAVAIIGSVDEVVEVLVGGVAVIFIYFVVYCTQLPPRFSPATDEVMVAVLERVVE